MDVMPLMMRMGDTYSAVSAQRASYPLQRNSLQRLPQGTGGLVVMLCNGSCVGSIVRLVIDYWIRGLPRSVPWFPKWYLTKALSEANVCLPLGCAALCQMA